MNSNIKEEKREFYKPFRTVGGFILAITFISSIIMSLMTGVIIVNTAIFKDSLVANIISELCIYGSIIYAYYIGYRIFIKKYTKRIIDISFVKKNKIISCIFSSIIIFSLIRITWILWDLLLNKVGYVTEGTESKFYIVGIIYVTVLAPVIEEIIFRGWLLKILNKYGVITAVIISSITFGIYHGTVIQFLPATIIGILLSYLVVKYKTIIPGIILHILNNTLSIINLNLDNYSELLNTIIIIVTLGAIIVLLYLLIKNYKKIITSIKMTFNLMFHSVSYILFLIFYILLIIIDFIGISLN